MSTDTDPKRALSNLKKRRGVAKASISRLENKSRELERDHGLPSTKNAAKQMLTKLQEATTGFRQVHLSIVDLLEEETDLEVEQAILDEHDDIVSAITLRLKALIEPREEPRPPDERKILARRLKRVEGRLTSVNEAITALGETPDLCHVERYVEQLQDDKKELAELSVKLYSLDLEDTDELVTLHTGLEERLFDYMLRAKRLAQSRAPLTDDALTRPESRGIKLPKLEVPSFSGHILNWSSFWEQFEVSVHNSTSLSNSEKLVYLQQALKGGSAKNTIEGLSRTGDNYTEAVASLKARYDRPRLIHQAHVKSILEAPALKEGSGREIRKLHDTVQQHLRALRSMGHEPSGPFITATLELKLDQNTMFEWQKHSHATEGIPHYQELLEFLNLRAQATETSLVEQGVKKSRQDLYHAKNHSSNASVASHSVGIESPSVDCIVCKSEKHPLYACSKFRGMSHDDKVSTLKSNRLCLNCLGSNHFVKQCKSVHRCKQCQKPHHTLLHVDNTANVRSKAAAATQALVLRPNAAPYTPQGPSGMHDSLNSNQALAIAQDNSLVSNTAVKLNSNSLLMTCRVLVSAPDGTSVEARALLDNGSSASFISERLAQSLCLARTKQNIGISGIGGISHGPLTQSLVNFYVSPTKPSQTKVSITAVVVPKVTRDLPSHPVPFKLEWSHLSDLDLADPTFGQPGRVDILLGVDAFVTVLCHGRRYGPPGTPVAFETQFGWVLAGSSEGCTLPTLIDTHHVSCTTGDDILQKFWEIEDHPLTECSLNPEERAAVQHFKTNHTRGESGRFIVPLPRRENTKFLGESRSQAVKRFLSLERTFHARNQFQQVGDVIQEYFDLGHAEPVPSQALNKPPEDVFYLPMHVVRKESSTTTKIRAVFDASMKTASGVSLNDVLMVGPTIHPSLIDVLIRFRMHRIAIVADISKMYRAIELPPSDRDLHRFVWRTSPKDPLQDFRMTRVTFGVSSSSFLANMSVKQNAEDFAHKYPLAAKIVEEAFYVDDCLTGADSVEEGIQKQQQLRDLFSEADFVLRKWNSSNPAVLEAIPPSLRDTQTSLTISSSEDVYTKTLGIEWHSVLDHFRLSVAKQTQSDSLTKRMLVSDIARTYDVLGWFAPAIVKVKILLQKVWESKIGWDDEVPASIHQEWLLWRSQLKSLCDIHIDRCYFPKEAQIVSLQLHGFSDASASAYAGVVYLRMTDTSGKVHVSLITSKSKVAPIKRLTVPRLELCGAHLLTKLLEHTRITLQIPIEDVHAWTDSTIVVSWLDGNPRRFKTYVGNRISFILDRIPPSHWNHVPGEENPADCASRGLLPLELIEHDLWWSGPEWLKLPSSDWPRHVAPEPHDSPDEQRELCLLTSTETRDPVIPLDRFSSYTRLTRITAWVMRFISNCHLSRINRQNRVTSPLTVQEVTKAENYWLLYSQRESFNAEMATLAAGKLLSFKGPLLNLHPFLDSNKIMRVTGREQNSKLSYSNMHPVILHGKHPVTKLIIRAEHHRLLHAGPTLLTSSLNSRYHIVGGQKSVRSITRHCTICRRNSEKPKPQKMGQLPLERVTPDIVFENVGVDYAGPIQIKYGHVRKPTIVKAYICVFVSLSVKAVHLEIVSDLTTDAFISALRRFIARRGKPKLIWSDHGSNFVGAQKELRELFEFLKQQRKQNIISDFCSAQHIQWRYTPEKAPHFGGLWESAVKSMKYHLKRTTANIKLTFEECATVISQVEACLNSRPLVAIHSDDDGLEALTPGHFLIGRPIEALPDPSFSYRAISLLRRWHLCQAIVRQFWQRWSQEYLASLRRHSKWHNPTRNLCIGDIVVIQESDLVQTKWPLGKVIKTYQGQDGLVRVVDVKTQNGVYKRPSNKIALLLPA